VTKTLTSPTAAATPATADAEILRDYGPWPGVDTVHGVSFDGSHVWFAVGPAVNVLDPSDGRVVRRLPVPGEAGTAFDGRFLYQIAGPVIRRLDPETGAEQGTIPCPGNGCASGLAWGEGTLWVGQFDDRRILQIDPETGAVLRQITSDRMVTGVTWAGDELWHGTWDGERQLADLRRIDPETGGVIAVIAMPAGLSVSGLESDGNGTFYCGGGRSGKIRAVRKSL
jgi:outer membrane protein assembly factor BamB